MTQQIDPSSELFKLSQHYLDKLQSVMDDLHDSIKTLESAKEEFKKSKESKYVRFFYHPVIIVFLMLAAIIVSKFHLAASHVRPFQHKPLKRRKYILSLTH